MAARKSRLRWSTASRTATARPSGGMTGAIATAATIPTGTASRAASGRHRASRSSTRARPIRSSPCWRAWSSAAPGRSVAVSRQAAGRQDRHLEESQSTWFVGFSPDLACGVFVGFDNPAHARQARTGRHGRGPDLPRFHEGRAGRRAADAVPRRAGHRVSVGRPDDRQSGSSRARPAPSSKRSRRARRPATPAPRRNSMIGGDTPRWHQRRYDSPTSAKARAGFTERLSSPISTATLEMTSHAPRNPNATSTTSSRPSPC